MRLFDPGSNRLPGLLGDLELNRSMCLALHDHGAWQNDLALSDVANSQVDQVAPAQLAVDGGVEQSQVPRLFRKLEPYADCPDFLQLEGRLLSD